MGLGLLGALMIMSSASAQSWRTSETRNLGQVGYRNLGTDPQELGLRAQWIAPGYFWSKIHAPLSMSWIEYDASDHFTFRITAGGGTSWNNDRGDREWMIMGEAMVFFHSHRLEVITERITTSYQSSSQRVGNYVHTQSQEQYVNVPGYRLRMMGATAGVWAWRSLWRTRTEDELTMDRTTVHTPAFIGAAFIGYSNAWVKSNAYYIQGYGYAGRAAYSRFFVDLLIAPIRQFDADVNENDFIGGRLGVDNIWGKPTGYSLRAEVGIMPGGLGLYGLVTFGVGSLLGG